MPGIGAQIEALEQLLHDFDASLAAISRVRDLEERTLLTPLNAQQVGYDRVLALEGYKQLVRAYAALDDSLTAKQQAKLTTVVKIQEQLQQDGRVLEWLPPGEDRWRAAVQSYIEQKMSQLTSGKEISDRETYLLTGHLGHFNIVRIKELENGEYSYTRYDAGHESRVLGKEGGQYTVNAVEERRIKPGGLYALIEAEAIKINSDPKSDEYQKAAEKIESTLGETIRTETEHGQRKPNCTTRGQRILLADIVDDSALSEKMYNFIRDLDRRSTGDIREALQSKLDELKQMHARHIPISTGNVRIHELQKAISEENYDYHTVGGKMVYRTKPGAFSYDALETLKETLQNNGMDVDIRESRHEPGKHYLYVPAETAFEISNVLAQEARVIASAHQKARRQDNFESRRIYGSDGNPMDIYRTKDVFTPAEQRSLRNMLEQDGISATIQQHGSSPGTYVFAREEDRSRVHMALARCSSSVTTLEKFAANHTSAKRDLDTIRIIPGSASLPSSPDPDGIGSAGSEYRGKS